MQIPVMSHLHYYNIFPSVTALFYSYFDKFYDLVTLFLTVACTVLIHSLIRPL